jgi:low temperature requirement protein LtrA
VPFLQVFFAIWWAWTNYTWFASSFDTDDVPFRLLTMVQIAGVLVLAGGVAAGLDHNDYGVVTLGYLIMRLGLVAQWLRVAIEDSACRTTALRYVAGITAAQVGWALRLLVAEAGVLSDTLLLAIFVALAACELAVPLWAERTRPTSWHPHHIAERHGLFAIILLGESLFAASIGVQRALATDGVSVRLVTVGAAGLVLVFALWWLYFLQPVGDGLASNRARSYVWGYGHYGVFAALAATGAGLETAVAHGGHHVATSSVAVGYALAVPVAVFLILVWALHVPIIARPTLHPAVMLGGAAAILLLPPASLYIPLAAVVAAIATACAFVVGTTVVLDQRGRGRRLPQWLEARAA